MSAENAALVAYLRNRSPQLRAVVEAAQEAVESASLMVSANDGDPKCMAERTRLDAAAEALAAALKALDGRAAGSSRRTCRPGSAHAPSDYARPGRNRSDER